MRSWSWNATAAVCFVISLPLISTNYRKRMERVRNVIDPASVQFSHWQQHAGELCTYSIPHCANWYTCSDIGHYIHIYIYMSPRTVPCMRTLHAHPWNRITAPAARALLSKLAKVWLINIDHHVPIEECFAKCYLDPCPIWLVVCNIFFVFKYIGIQRGYN